MNGKILGRLTAMTVLLATASCGHLPVSNQIAEEVADRMNANSPMAIAYISASSTPSLTLEQAQDSAFRAFHQTILWAEDSNLSEESLWTSHPDLWQRYPELLPNESEPSAEQQELALALLMAETGAYATLMEGVRTDGETMNVSRDAFRFAVHQAAQEWSSLPLSNGLSIHHQAGEYPKALDELWNHFEEQLKS